MHQTVRPEVAQLREIPPCVRQLTDLVGMTKWGNVRTKCQLKSSLTICLFFASVKSRLTMRKYCPTFCKLFPTFTQQGSAPTISLIIFSLLVLGTFFTVLQAQQPQEIRTRAQVGQESAPLPPLSSEEVTSIVTQNNQLLEKIGAPASVPSSCPLIPIEEEIEKPDPARIQTLITQVSDPALGLTLALHTLDRSPASFQPQLTEQINKFASTRKPLFMELMRKDPDAAFRFLASRSQNIQTPSTPSGVSPNCIETPTTLEGTVEILHADFFEDKVSVGQYTLVTKDNQRIKLHPARSTSQLPISGITLKIKGYRLDNDFLFDGSNTTDINILPSTKSSSRANPLIKEAYAGHTDWHTQLQQDAKGEQKTVVLFVDFQNTTPPADVTRAGIQDLVFTQMKNYYKENSYNKLTDITGDVFPASGWYELSINRTCNTSDVLSKSVQAADSEVDFRNYTRLIIVVPTISCGWLGAASVGKSNVNTADGTVGLSISWNAAITLPVFGHEYGHNLGVHHAGYLNCGEKVVTQWCIDSAGAYREYADPFGIMGNIWALLHMNAAHKDYLGWLDPSNLIVPTSSSPGTYTVEPIETASSGIKAIKIPRGGRDFLYLEYRQPSGFDSSLLPEDAVFQGAIMHIPLWYGLFYDYDHVTLLLDASPTFLPSSSERDPVLQVGNSFTDYKSGVIVKTVAKSATGLTIEVTPNALDLVPSSLDISPANPNIGDPIVFSTTVKNQGVGNVEVFSTPRLLLDIGNNGSFDRSIWGNSASVAPIPSGETKSASWRSSEWSWLGNSVSETAQTGGWSLSLPSYATAFGFGLWWDGFDMLPPLSGDRENYEIKFGSPTQGFCSRFARGGGLSFGKGGCKIVSNVSSDISFSNGFNFPPPNDTGVCQLQYQASNRSIIPIDVSSTTSCQFTVFLYGPVFEAVSGTHNVRVCADFPNDIKESSEDNNCKSQLFTVPSSDLTVESITLSKPIPAVGDSINLSASVKNLGTGNLAANSTTTLRLDFKNNGTWDVGPLDVSTGSLVAGALETATWPNITISQGGTHKVEVCADSPNGIYEPNETNNCVSQTFKTVTPPILTPIGNKTTEVTQQLFFTVSGYDPDDDPLTYQGQPLPYGPSLKFQASPLPLGSVFLPLGDVTLDNKIDVGDSLFITQYLDGSRTFNKTQLVLADVTEDNLITKADVDAITKLTVAIPGASHMNKYRFIWKPEITQAATYSITFKLSDAALEDSETITLLVLPKPISHWKFDETLGTTAADSADNNPGTLVNGPTWTTGKIGGAVNLDGVNDYINISPNANLTMGTGSFTIAGWINLDVVCGPSWSNKICPIISTRDLNSGTMADGYWIGLALSHLWFQIGDGTANNGDFLVPYSYTNSWHHIAAVRDRSTNQFKLYIDAVLKGTDPDTLGDVGNSLSPRIGRGFSFYFDGRIDDLRVYNIALSLAEIAALAQ